MNKAEGGGVVVSPGICAYAERCVRVVITPNITKVVMIVKTMEVIILFIIAYFVYVLMKVVNLTF